MTHQREEQLHRPGVRPSTLLHWIVHALGVVAPMLLVIYAFGASADAAERAQIVVSGCTTLTLMLVCNLALAALYRLGFEAGLQATRQDSGAMGRPVAA